MKIVPDTNVLIGFFRNPDAKDAFEARHHRPSLFMSSIVALELRAGCRTPRQEKELAGFLKPFEKASRLILPDHGTYMECGRVLAKLMEDGISAPHRRSLVPDILIAVSSSRAGAMVVTANKHDFARIEKYTPVHWMLPG